MYREMLELLVCPDCHSSFQLTEISVIDEEIIEGILWCEHGHRYWIHEGVVDFCTQEQGMANQWSEMYQETDYETLDKEIEQAQSAEEIARQNQLFERFIEELSTLKQGTIVDIASGRGMLLRALAPHLNAQVQLIATDLSYQVLRYDRLKLKKINPHLRVNYLTCDATKLPLKDGCVDRAVSFFGIANMLGLVDQGIQEAARILKSGGKLLNALIVIHEHSRGFAALQQFCQENEADGAQQAYVLSTLQAMHQAAFPTVACQVVYEGISPVNDQQLDLLPYPGEWFGQIIFSGEK